MSLALNDQDITALLASTETLAKVADMLRKDALINERNLQWQKAIDTKEITKLLKIFAVLKEGDVYYGEILQAILSYCSDILDTINTDHYFKMWELFNTVEECRNAAEVVLWKIFYLPEVYNDETQIKEVYGYACDFPELKTTISERYSELTTVKVDKALQEEDFNAVIRALCFYSAQGFNITLFMEKVLTVFCKNNDVERIEIIENLLESKIERKGLVEFRIILTIWSDHLITEALVHDDYSVVCALLSRMCSHSVQEILIKPLLTIAEKVEYLPILKGILPIAAGNAYLESKLLFPLCEMALDSDWFALLLEVISEHPLSKEACYLLLEAMYEVAEKNIGREKMTEVFIISESRCALVHEKCLRWLYVHGYIQKQDNYD